MKGLEEVFKILLGILILLALAYIGHFALKKEIFGIVNLPSKNYLDLYFSCETYLNNPDDYTTFIKSHVLDKSKYYKNMQKIMQDCNNEFLTKKECKNEILEKTIIACSIVKAISMACNEICGSNEKACIQTFLKSFDDGNLWSKERNTKCLTIDGLRDIVTQWCTENFGETNPTYSYEERIILYCSRGG